MAKGADSSGKGKRAGRNGNAPPASRRWRPGQSGNPKGRPKGRLDLWSRVEAWLAKKIPGRDGDMGDLFVESMMRAATREPIKATPLIRELLRISGRSEDREGPGEESAGGPFLRPNLKEFGERLRRMAEIGRKGVPPHDSPSAKP